MCIRVRLGIESTLDQRKIGQIGGQTTVGKHLLVHRQVMFRSREPGFDRAFSSAKHQVQCTMNPIIPGYWDIVGDSTAAIKVNLFARIGRRHNKAVE